MTLIFPYLDAILKALHDNSTLHALVDGNLFKFKSLEESEPCLGKSLHQSLISVELKGWPGSKLVANPVPIIDIRCRKGPEDCLRIAKQIKDILDDGISEVIDGTTYAISVSGLAGDMAWNETLQAWRVIIEAQGIIYTAATITSLTPSLASPQKPKSKVYWFCACPESATDDIQYRFSLNGPGTGNVWQDMTGWTVQAYWQWTVSAADVGSNQVKVEVRNAEGLPSADDFEIANYTVSANALPVLTSLISSIASPQAMGTKISFIAVASDSEGDWILYRFWLKGPGTGNVWQDRTGWVTKNEWTWTPEARDVGSNQVKVDIIDQQHAGRSGYDATTTISFTVNDNELPSISELAVIPISPQQVGIPIKLVCDAFPNDSDALLFKFTVLGPGTGFLEVALTDWQAQNTCIWKSQLEDVGHSVFKVYVRDGNHAGPGSHDDIYENEFDVLATAPAVASLTPTLASPQVAEREITFICVASDIDSNIELQYKFWLRGPTTANLWQPVTGWRKVPSWTWKTTIQDTGTNYVKAQVRNGKLAGPGSYDADDLVVYVINS